MMITPVQAPNRNGGIVPPWMLHTQAIDPNLRPKMTAGDVTALLTHNGFVEVEVPREPTR